MAKGYDIVNLQKYILKLISNNAAGSCLSFILGALMQCLGKNRGSIAALVAHLWGPCE